MHIRPESSDDADAIHGVTAHAFANTPHSDGSEPHVVRALRDAGALVVSLVAEEDGVVVGHVAVSAVTFTDGATGWYGLGPVSVEPARQGRGIGSALVRAALDRLVALKAAGCVVLGNPAYYRRFGFVAYPGLTYPGLPAEYFMAVPLSAADAAEMPRGEVSYHAAFGFAG